MKSIIDSSPSLNKGEVSPFRKLVNKGFVPAGLLLLAISWPGHAHESRKDVKTATAEKVAAFSGAKTASGRSPLTVFIDGPTGFVYVFTAEGWKFVGGRDTSKL